MTTQDHRKPRMLVTAATGKTGTAVTRQLLDKGYPVTALARREDRRSAALATAGATIVVGDLIEPDDLRHAMQGVQRAYFAAPRTPTQLHGAMNFAVAAADAKLDAVVVTQWLAQPNHPSVATRESYLTDRIFAWMPGVATVTINTGWFADNYMGVLPMAAQLGIFPFRLGDAKVAPVSSEDIARVAVGVLVNPAPHVGRYYRPTGPELLGPDPQQTNPIELVRSAVVTAVTSEIVIDGSLDEAPWHQAPKIGDLVQRIPEAGAEPTEKTQVTPLYDEENLYIGVMCHDSEPRRVLASGMARDARLNADDRLGIVLDTFRDQSNAFHFSTNPAGALVDGLVFANGETNDDWDGIWIVRTQQTHEGWSAEFAIPFKTLSFPSGETVWGFNISRTIQRKLEENRWTGARFQTQFFQISEAGEITYLEGPEQGVGLDVRPFVAPRWLHRGTDADDTIVGKPGLDLFYNITPSLKLSATVNTDFGETEVDARQINLTRFSIFFPEKRSFFLQDAGVFNFATTGISSLPQGNFIARIHSSQVNYAVSPFLSFSNVIQFDNRSGNLGLQSRVRWTVAPGNDVFFIFGQGWVQDLERGYDFRRQDSRLATKLQYTFRS